MLKQWNSPESPYQVVVMFKWRTYFDTVIIGCSTRREVAHVFWQLRRARRSAAKAPRHSVADFPQFGYRWLACRWLEVSYSHFDIQRRTYVDSKPHMLTPGRTPRPLNLKPRSIFDLII